MTRRLHTEISGPMGRRRVMITELFRDRTAAALPGLFETFEQVLNNYIAYLRENMYNTQHT